MARVPGHAQKALRQHSTVEFHAVHVGQHWRAGKVLWMPLECVRRGSHSTALHSLMPCMKGRIYYGWKKV